MTEAEFDSLYQNTLLAIEDAVDAADADLDFETVGDVLTISCPDGSQIIISRQVANQQLWVAARSGGYHFAWSDEASEWRLTRDSERSLQSLLEEAIKAQAGLSITLS